MVRRGQRPVAHRGPGNWEDNPCAANCQGLRCEVHCCERAKWQSAGALDSHLSAMRADFAEAHRYAPAILFIDEIDSIGSREKLRTKMRSIRRK